MSTTEIVVQENRALSAPEIKDQVQLIQQVMKAVMLNGTHYGKIPGCGDKPALLKPGAEKLASTFRFAIDPQVEDLSDGDHCRFRVRASISHQVTGQYLGTGIGEASGAEVKYAWRGVVCDAEFEHTPETQKRLKWERSGSATKQVRTNQADIANTVLKMAKKRALVDAVLTITAASDIFTQDLEDMPEEIRETAEGETATREPERKQQTVEVISESQAKRAFAIGKGKGFTIDQYRAVIKRHGFDSDKDIPKNPKTVYDNIVAELEKGPRNDAAA